MTSLGEPLRKRRRNGNFYFIHQALIERELGECTPGRKNLFSAASIFHPF